MGETGGSGWILRVHKAEASKVGSLGWHETAQCVATCHSPTVPNNVAERAMAYEPYSLQTLALSCCLIPLPRIAPFNSHLDSTR